MQGLLLYSKVRRTS